MTKLTKIAAVALAALTISASSLATANQAQAFSGKKALVGLGIAAAAATVIGSVAAAASEPRCKTIERFDRFGRYRGSMQICD